MTDPNSPAAPPHAWVRCDRCGAITYRRRLDRALGVCVECGWHSPLTAEQRLAQLLDPGTRRLLSVSPGVDDPLGFVDTQPYAQRLADARARTGLTDAVIAALGEIDGRRLVVAVMDFRFLGGSLGCSAGEVVTVAAERARDERVPLLVVTASGGARMQEGALSLMQMAKTSQAFGELDESGLLTISLVTDPTYGGVAASFATLADVILAEPGARLGFAGPRVIRQTLGEPLPEGFQTAEFLLAGGLVDQVVPRSHLRATLARLLRAQGEAGTTTPCGPDRLVRDPAAVPTDDAWETVRRARSLDRPSTLDYLGHALDGFQELHGDRVGGDCPAIIGGIGEIAGFSLVVVGHQKGHDTRELAARNFGMATPAGYRKAARLMRLAEKLRLPVVTLIDTPGAYPGRAAEEGGQAHSIAANLRLMAALRVPVVAVVTGEGGSGGALGIAVADRVLAFAGATYSVISPEGCAAILWRRADAAPTAAAALRLDAAELLRLGVLDAVIPEPAGGADPTALAAAHLRDAVVGTLEELRAVPVADLVAARRRRYRRFGAPGAPLSEPAGGRRDAELASAEVVR